MPWSGGPQPAPDHCSPQRLLLLVDGGDVKGLALRVCTRLGHGSRLAVRGHHDLCRRGVRSLQGGGGLQGIRIDLLYDSASASGLPLNG